MPGLNLGTTRLCFRLEGGHGLPRLLLLHPVGADHSLFDAIVPALLQHYQVLRPDLRGHGGSSSPTAEAGMRGSPARGQRTPCRVVRCIDHRLPPAHRLAARSLPKRQGRTEVLFATAAGGMLLLASREPVLLMPGQLPGLALGSMVMMMLSTVGLAWTLRGARVERRAGPAGAITDPE